MRLGWEQMKIAGYGATLFGAQTANRATSFGA
jgi:hypothetical protein